VRSPGRTLLRASVVPAARRARCPDHRRAPPRGSALRAAARLGGPAHCPTPLSEGTALAGAPRADV